MKEPHSQKIPMYLFPLVSFSIFCMVEGSFQLWLPCGSVVKNMPASTGDAVSIPGSGRSPGGGNSNPLQYSCLENPMGRGAWRATVHGVAKSQPRLCTHVPGRIRPEKAFVINQQIVRIPWYERLKQSGLFCWKI